MQVRKKILIFGLFVLAKTIFMPLHAANIEPLENIQETAYRFVEQRLALEDQTNTQIQVQQLDSRLRLSACSEALEAFLPNSTPTRITTVGVRCNGSKPWSLFVPVQVRSFTQVVVATQPLARGTLLSKDNLRLVQKETSRLRGGYSTQIEDLVGRVSKRSLAANQPIMDSYLAPNYIVKKGEPVTIRAQGDNFMIYMEGIALGDGERGDRIQVRNNQSQRVVDAWVSDSRKVDVHI